MNYEQLLQDSYKTSLATECPPNSKIEFLACHIFDFTTYDSKMDALLGEKAVEVFRAISTGQTFEHVADQEQYRWYIIMCNMPFFANRLNWGTSIRGAWWDSEQPPLESCGLFLDGMQILNITFSPRDWEAFANSVLAFAAD